MYKKSALEIKELFIHKKKSSVEIIKYFLKRIEKYDPQIKSFIEVYNERALKKAKELDQRLKENKPIGKLASIPIAIKDNILIRNENCTCASKFLKNYKAPYNASVIELLEKEDAIIIGKTNLDEFAMGSSGENSSFFVTKNPWDLSCTPGGSSSGSAASVAARLVPISLGTDTGGSIRQPAAFCGIIGHKPTYGRVSRYGLVAFGSSLDQIGPFTTNTLDAALVMEVLGSKCEMDATSLHLPNETYLENLNKDLKSKKIGIPFHFLENLNPSTKKNFDESIEVFKKLGADIVDINLDILKYSIAVYYILATAEASTNLARFDGIRYGVRSKNAKSIEEVYELSRDEGFGKEVKRRIILGSYVLSSSHQDAFYKKASKVRSLIINAYNEAFEKCDFILMPTSPTTSFKLNSIQDPVSMYLQDLFTISVNLSALPATSVPSGFDSENKPFGIQIIGPQMHDVNVIKYANIFERKLSIFNKIPPMFDKE
ncbi:MAG: Glutamyl-tRNA(Gln) amidotransferase subunit A [Candidatus Anoxychlamydiales bacterium]|nr:Glutamyl-tRNA(Gln) amidotransferase subunit A [Candidatus Anoxychlamydiales bacterium]